MPAGCAALPLSLSLPSLSLSLFLSKLDGCNRGDALQVDQDHGDMQDTPLISSRHECLRVQVVRQASKLGNAMLA